MLLVPLLAPPALTAASRGSGACAWGPSGATNMATTTPMVIMWPTSTTSRSSRWTRLLCATPRLAYWARASVPVLRGMRRATRRPRAGPWRQRSDGEWLGEAGGWARGRAVGAARSGAGAGAARAPAAAARRRLHGHASVRGASVAAWWRGRCHKRRATPRRRRAMVTAAAAAATCSAASVRRVHARHVLQVCRQHDAPRLCCGEEA